jgi:hypothetical protein
MLAPSRRRDLYNFWRFFYIKLYILARRSPGLAKVEASPTPPARTVTHRRRPRHGGDHAMSVTDGAGDGLGGLFDQAGRGRGRGPRQAPGWRGPHRPDAAARPCGGSGHIVGTPAAPFRGGVPGLPVVAREHPAERVRSGERQAIKRSRAVGMGALARTAAIRATLPDAHSAGTSRAPSEAGATSGRRVAFSRSRSTPRPSGSSAEPAAWS